MTEALALHRFQFAFTVTFHYLFPQLTMGLSLFLVVFQLRAYRGDALAALAARFWARIFALNFLFGVVTGIPLEFQIGTSWAGFARATGAVVGQLLALEGVLSFFLESTFLGLFLAGPRRIGRRLHLVSAFLLGLGAWLSGYFVVCANAWMQHPVGHTISPDGSIELARLSALLLNPWALWQYLHTMCASVVTASFVLAATGAFYLLTGRHEGAARSFVRLGVTVGLAACLLQIFPTGDAQGRLVALHQPVTLAAMEGLFETESGAALTIIGQPDVARRRMDNPIQVPRLLSFLTYQRWKAEVRGLTHFPESTWPDQIPLLYFSYHVMVGLGTLFVALLAAAAWRLWRGQLFVTRPLLWALMLAAPFPYIANTAGWLTAELGRQPWIVYGVMRTAHAASTQVSAGNVFFSLLGFLGLYSVLSILFLFLVQREIDRGPEATEEHG